MALAKITPVQHYASNNMGQYQFISLKDIVNNFIVSQVGDDKIIKSAKRSEVLYHAQRGIAELNYDTLGNIKTQEIELPPSLSVALPHDFVNIVEICFVNSKGILYPIQKSSVSADPSSIQQNIDYDYIFDYDGFPTIASQSVTADRFLDATKDNVANKNEINFGYTAGKGARYGIDPTLANKNGSYLINDKFGLISFSGDLAGSIIVLKYISDGLHSDADMEIHKFAEEAMYKSITYGVASAKTNIPEYQINRFKKEKRASIRQAKLRLAKISVPEIIQSMRIKAKQIKH